MKNDMKPSLTPYCAREGFAVLLAQGDHGRHVDLIERREQRRVVLGATRRSAIRRRIKLMGTTCSSAFLIAAG